MKETTAAVLAAGPFVLTKEVLFEQFEEFFETILEQAQLSDDQQKQLAENLKSIEKRDKLGSCLFWIEAQAAALKKEEQRLASRRATFERFYSTIAESIHAQMKELGVKKVEGMKTTFAVKKNPPSVVIDDESAIPAEFIDYAPTISKQRIGDELKAGKEVAGAHLVKDRTRIEIK